MKQRPRRRDSLPGMGIQLNLGDFISRFEEFVAFPNDYRADIQWARSQAKAIANTKPGANVYFRSLPAGRTLSSMLNDRSLWVSWWNGTTTAWGYTIGYDGKFEIGISYYAFRGGKKRVLGTLIHELAHVGGADETNTAAEDALYHCGLGTKTELLTGVDDPSTPFIPGYRG